MFLLLQNSFVLRSSANKFSFSSACSIQRTSCKVAETQCLQSTILAIVSPDSFQKQSVQENLEDVLGQQLKIHSSGHVHRLLMAYKKHLKYFNHLARFSTVQRINFKDVEEVKPNMEAM